MFDVVIVHIGVIDVGSVVDVGVIDVDSVVVVNMYHSNSSNAFLQSHESLGLESPLHWGEGRDSGQSQNVAQLLQVRDHSSPLKIKTFLFFNIKCGWLVIIIYLGRAGDQGGDSGRGLAEPGPRLPAGDEPSQPGQDPSSCK